MKVSIFFFFSLSRSCNVKLLIVTLKRIVTAFFDLFAYGLELWRSIYIVSFESSDLKNCNCYVHFFLVLETTQDTHTVGDAVF